MSLLEDLFGEDDLFGDPGELETIEEGVNENSEENNTEENSEEQSGTKVEVKKRIIRNPQPKLNADRLRGPRGIATLESVYQNVKFKGKGHEKEDLKKVLWKLEHWCHRLYPKFQFDDCLDKIEKLGSKKVVQTYVKKIRLGMVDIDAETAVLQEQKNEDEVLPPEDEFDQLLDQQIAVLDIEADTQNRIEITEEMQERMNKNREIARQKLLAKRLAEEQQLMEYEATLDQRRDESTEILDNLNPNWNNDENIVVPITMESELNLESSSNDNKTTNQTLLTEEQMKRIERNRLLAIQKRLDRLKQIEGAKSKEKMDDLNVSEPEFIN